MNDDGASIVVIIILWLWLLFWVGGVVGGASRRMYKFAYDVYMLTNCRGMLKK